MSISPISYTNQKYKPGFGSKTLGPEELFIALQNKALSTEKINAVLDAAKKINKAPRGKVLAFDSKVLDYPDQTQDIVYSAFVKSKSKKIGQQELISRKGTNWVDFFILSANEFAGQYNKLVNLLKKIRV